MTARLTTWLAIMAIAAIAVAACGRSDATINTAVKEKITTDPTVKSAAIDVTTKDGVVTLSGTVDTAGEKERAVTLARQTNRVLDVVDRLDVRETSPTTGTWPPGPRGHHGGFEREGMPMGDDGIEAAVRSRLTTDALVGTLGIDVDADRGVVSLSGRVRSEAERVRAIELARQTRGVMRVEDHVDVRR